MSPLKLDSQAVRAKLERVLGFRAAYNAARLFSRKLRSPGQVLRSSIKGEVKKKHFSGGRSFSCFPAHVIEGELF